ncbi:MAG TPA: FAD:protein FMN transferase [Thermoanaerobaculia bacterium]|nr:FAD:protein FMN transferase [Thermoanaerobaculia bacterium]
MIRLGLLGRIGKIAALPLLLTSCVGAGPVPSVDRVERRLSLMGTSLDVAIEAADRETALLASERAVSALEAAEARLSTWRDDSELARLNQAPAGSPVVLSEDLADNLAAARQCWNQTDGAFDPTVGPLVRAWGLREGGRLPEDDELRSALTATGLDGLRLDGRTAVREEPGLILEEGGFGKGAGLAEALAVLAEIPGVRRATLDLGGQVALLSRAGDPAGSDWTVPVADPRRRDREVIALTVDRGSVSTSGNSERGIEVEGRRIGHLLDPRTGRPAPDFGSLTVWTADPLAADCLSTGLYVMGPEAALDWAAAHPGVEVLALRPRGERLEALATPGLRGRLEALTGDVGIHFWTLQGASAVPGR